MTRTELVDAVYKDLEARSTWDTRQSMFYEMRHHGLRRSNKPWPNASDLHFPLCDSAIERLKPAYFQQLFSSDLVANFVPSGQGLQATEHTSAAALWFDHQLKHGSAGFELELLRAIDGVLVSGRSVVKIFWCPEKGRMKFLAIPAQLIIVPQWTEELEDADRIVHVQTYSVESYRRQPQFRQGIDFERKIVGRGETEETAQLETLQSKHLREGLTHSDEEKIVLWEVWTRDVYGAWGFEVLSPLCPDEPVRYRVKSPYAHGLPPFVAFAYEEKEAGWYSPRGVVEILATFEAQLCKLLNEKNDAMTLYNRPLFTSERDMGNQQNLRWVPGQILPFSVKPVQMPAPPISFDQEILMTRDIAERLVAVPDFGMSQVTDRSNSRTATEIAAIGQTSQQSADLRLRVFRLALAKLYRMAWSTLKQYKADDLMLWSEERLVSVPAEAIAGEYRIEPSGSADGMTRQQGHAKAIARLQLLGQSPFVDQGELTKTVLEADDPGLVKRLYRDPGTQAADGTEEQGKEIGVMLLGFPVAVSPGDNHAAHLQAILDFVLRMAQRQSQASPESIQMLLPHAAQHLEALASVDKQAAAQFQQAFAAIVQQMGGQQQPQEAM